MKRTPIIFLKLVIIFIGIATFSFDVFFTTAVAREERGLFIPILVIMYITAIPFFLALYQTLRLLSFIEKNKAFSESSVQALKIIRYCAIAISALYVAGMPFIFSAADKDDAPGAVGIGIVFIFSSIVIATFAAVLQKIVQSGLRMKSENDLTV